MERMERDVVEVFALYTCIPREVISGIPNPIDCHNYLNNINVCKITKKDNRKVALMLQSVKE